MIIKKSRSGKGLIVVDDFGNTYGTSVTYLLGMISDRTNGPGFVQLVRFPSPASADRFKPSPVLGKGYEKIDFDDLRWTPPVGPEGSSVKAASDGLSSKGEEMRSAKEGFSDKVVW